MAWNPPALFVPGPLLAAQLNQLRESLLALRDITADGTWTTYTPTWANVTPGTGPTNSAKFIQVGKLLTIKFQLTLGTGGSFASSPPTMTLPIAAASADFLAVGTAIAMDSGSAGSRRAVTVYQNNLAGSVTFLVSDNGAGDQRVINTVPFTWGAGDQLGGTLCVEVA
jgi:hypothetical protein